IVSARPDALFMLQLEHERTNVYVMNKDNLENARQLLSEIGSRFSDVFGADGVVWAEGQTEVECFLLLINVDRKRLSSNTIIARLANVDDLQGRHAEIIAEAYRNLSSAGSLLPPNIVVSTATRLKVRGQTYCAGHMET